MDKELLERVANTLGFHLLDTGVYDHAKDVSKMAHELAEFAISIIAKQERWNVGEELCCLIGNLMLRDMSAGRLLGDQLKDYINNYLKVGGSGQSRDGE